MTADPFNLARFVAAQERVYGDALAELRAGRKNGHWMWFVFPQVAGLGSSSTSRLYAIGSLDEARAYLRHPLLGPRLAECADAVLAHPGALAADIFPYPDDLKLKSSMTLFERAAPGASVFGRVLDQLLGGNRDERTLLLLR